MPNTARRQPPSLLCVLLLILASPLALAGPAADFSLPDGNGNTVKLSDYRGKVVYLDFWASWCGPCRESFPWMNEMLSRHAAQGLQIVAVNLDSTRDDATAFLARHPAQFKVLFDATGKTPTTYGVKGMPTSFLIDRDGNIVKQHTGFNSAQEKDLEATVNSLLEQHP